MAKLTRALLGAFSCRSTSGPLATSHTRLEGITLGKGDELLKDKVNSLVNQGHKKILLNFADVPHGTARASGEIVRTYTTVSRQGGNLKLLNLTKRITDLLAITKLLTVFETFDAENDAIRSFSASAKV